MTAWTSAERADLRAYVGTPATFRQFEPRFDSAITAVQSYIDGGNLPDSATQDRMRLVMAQLAVIDCKLAKTQSYAQAISVDDGDIKVDYIRANAMLKMEGRRLITQLCTPLGLRGPFQDYYSSLPVLHENFGGNSPFFTNNG